MHERSGITRDRKELATDWNGRSFALIDTGGVDLEDTDPLAVSIQDQVREALSDADVALLVVDAQARASAPATRRSPTCCARAACRSCWPRTRSTRRSDFALVHDFHGLGLGEPMAVSAAQGLGTGDLLDRLVELLPEGDEPDEDEDLVRLAVIGRPNVGKSSLVNAFLGRERVIVSDIAGTTRDAIDTPIEVDGRKRAAGRHRRHPPRGEGLGVGRVLHDAALPARGRARRRRARGLRRHRRRDLAGPADRRHGDEGGLRDRARAQQVGPHERRRLRPRPRARAGQPQAAPAPEGADHLGARPAATSAASWSRRCRWPSARRTASRRRSSTASSATWWRAARRRRSRGGG